MVDRKLMKTCYSSVYSRLVLFAWSIHTIQVHFRRVLGASSPCWKRLLSTGTHVSQYTNKPRPRS